MEFLPAVASSFGPVSSGSCQQCLINTTYTTAVAPTVTAAPVGIGSGSIAFATPLIAVGCAAVGLAAGCLLTPLVCSKRRRTNDGSYVTIVHEVPAIQSESGVSNSEDEDLLKRTRKLGENVEVLGKMYETALRAELRQSMEKHIRSTEDKLETLHSEITRKTDGAQLDELGAAMLKHKASVDDDDVPSLAESESNQKAKADTLQFQELLLSVVGKKADANSVPTNADFLKFQRRVCAHVDATQLALNQKIDSSCAAVPTTGQFEKLQTSMRDKADVNAVPSIANSDRIYTLQGDLQCCISESGRLGLWRISSGEFVKWVCDHEQCEHCSHTSIASECVEVGSSLPNRKSSAHNDTADQG